MLTDSETGIKQWLEQCSKNLGTNGAHGTIQPIYDSLEVVESEFDMNRWLQRAEELM